MGEPAGTLPPGRVTSRAVLSASRAGSWDAPPSPARLLAVNRCHPVSWFVASYPAQTSRAALGSSSTPDGTDQVDEGEDGHGGCGEPNHDLEGEAPREVAATDDREGADCWQRQDAAEADSD
jgi:hypothetical protein